MAAGQALVQKKFFSVTLPIKPVSKGRPRFSRGRAYTPEKTVNSEAEIRWLVQMEKPPKILGALAMNLRVILLKPKSLPKCRLFPTARPDLDNYVKLVCDALNGICYADDSQVVMIAAQKEYGPQELIHLSLEEL